ncbi:MAG: hypothetical protein ACK4LT_00680 [Aquificaceae bacterium]
MKEIFAKAVKKVTLELVYEVVNERTKAILEEIAQIKKRQEEDFRFLNQRIDTQTAQLREEIGQLRQEIGQNRQEIYQLNQKIDTQIAQVREEIGQVRQEMAQLRQEIYQINQRIDQLNQRIDTVIQLLIDLRR